MNDMSMVIVPKSDQINADDLIAGPRTITITGVDIRPGTEQPVSIHFDGDGGKPYKACKSMCRVMVAAWGPDAKTYVGRSLTLYRDPSVKWGGMEVGGIRISHMSHIERDMVLALTATKGSRKPFTVRPLKAEQREDKVTPGVNALIARIDAAADQAALEVITGEDAVTKQRAWLEKNRPDLAARVTEAVTTRLADFAAADGAAPDDGFPGELSNADGTARAK
jgi:hypothetical protein